MTAFDSDCNFLQKEKKKVYKIVYSQEDRSKIEGGSLKGLVEALTSGNYSGGTSE